MLKLGDKTINKLYLGDKAISKAYLGDKLVYQAGNPIFVEYIQSDGNQYIDTGVSPSYDYTIKIKYSYTTFESSYNCIFGTRSQPQSEGNQIYWVGCNKFDGVLMTRMGKAVSTYAIKLNETYELIITPDEATINGTSIGDAMYDGEIGFSKSIRLFTINDASPNLFVSSAKIYYFQIYDKDMNLIQDLRPCIDPNGVVCMYDMVTKKYFYNQGTGEFIPVPRFVEYIQSTGTQYIDLGYISPERAKTLRFVADMSIDTASGYRLCGGGSNNRQLYFGFAPSKTFAYGLGNVDASVGGVYVKVGIKYHYDYDVLNGLYIVSENGTTVVSKQFEFSEYIGSNFYLFCYAGAKEVPTALWSGKMYSFLVYENNTLIQHLRPALDYNNVACMYDTVTGTYFYNQGTGEFISGDIL